MKAGSFISEKILGLNESTIVEQSFADASYVTRGKTEIIGHSCVKYIALLYGGKCFTGN